MRFVFQPMQPSDVLAVAAWHYDEPYTFYDMQADPDDLREFQDFAHWQDPYYSVFDDAGALIGYFVFKRRGDGIIELGLGLHPKSTGQGMGLSFVQEGIAFAKETFRPLRIVLAVATFNERAIKVYERAGFKRLRTYLHRTNGADYEFLEMTLA
jgi:ribosomal-protein-alanine N-acetyltransferase